MTELFEILKILIPSLIVFLTAYLVIREFLKKEESKRKLEIALANQKEITPIRLQAYERLVIFLERIHPESLIVRESKQGLSNVQLQQQLVFAIRNEFEHNLAQQIYVTPELWNKIKMAKESIIQLINAEALQLIASDASIGLSKAVIEAQMQIQNSALDVAIEELKKEIANFWQ